VGSTAILVHVANLKIPTPVNFSVIQCAASTLLQIIYSNKI